MKHLTAIAGVLIALGGAAVADTRIELIDGSVVQGTFPAGSTLKMRTKYGVADVPLSDLVTLEVGMDDRPDFVERIDGWVRDLVSPDAARAAAARERLTAAGPQAKDVLQAYLNRPDDIDPKIRNELLSIIAQLSSPREPFRCATIPASKVSSLYARSDAKNARDLLTEGRLLTDQITVVLPYATVKLAVGDILTANRVSGPRTAIGTEPAAARLGVEADDGSVIYGNLAEPIEFEALGIRMTLAPRSIRDLSVGGDRAVLVLVNGDVLKGRLLTEKVVLQTPYGKTTVPKSHLVRLCGRLRKGLIAQWSFDGNPIDGAGNWQKTNRTAICYWPGKVGWGFNNDVGGGLFAATNPSGNRLSATLTVAMWIRPHEFTAPMRPLWHKNANAEGTIFIQPDRFLYYRFETSQNLMGSGVPFPVAEVGKWAHIVMVRDAEKHAMLWYINGELKATSSFTQTPLASDDPIMIGYNGTERFRGEFDEVGMWDRPLTAEEVKELYELGNAGKRF